MRFNEFLKHHFWTLEVSFVVLVMIYAYFWGERSERAIRSFCCRRPWLVAVVVIVVVDVVTMTITGPANFPSGLYAVLAGASGMAFHRSFRGKPNE